MSMELSIVWLAFAALAGAAVVYFALVTPARKARESMAVEKAAAAVTAERVPELERTIAELRERLEAADRRIAEAASMLETERKSHAARVEELEKMGAEIERKFTVLASEALGKNSESFLKLVTERFDKHQIEADKDLDERRKAIEALVKPIGENLAKFEHKVGEIEKTREGAYRAITEQVRNLAEGQTGLRSETSRLVQALRQPKTRGRWGEYQLRNVLEMAGMTEHVDFLEEHTVQGEDGRLRPDVIVRLPGGKSVIVDAKTPLEAYLSAVDTTDDGDRERHMADHARHVREHARSLGSKEYWKALPETPDFVVMFLPGEAFYAAAIDSDPGLFEQALQQKVLISTPTTLIALVKAIAYGWQQETLAKNAQAVAGLAQDLYERIRTFGGHIDQLGRSLRQAVERYNSSVGSLEGRVLPAARKFETMGAVPVSSSIDEIKPVDLETRTIQAAELTTPPDSESKD